MPRYTTYDDFSRVLFLHAHREASALTNEIPEESDQFRFLRDAFYTNIKGSVGLILTKAYPWGFLYLLTCHLDLLYLCRASFVGSETPSSTFSSLPCFYSSVFYLRDTPKVKGDGGSVAQKCPGAPLPDTVRARKNSSTPIASETTADKGSPDKSTKFTWQKYNFCWTS